MKVTLSNGEVVEGYLPGLTGMSVVSVELIAKDFEDVSGLMKYLTKIVYPRIHKAHLGNKEINAMDCFDCGEAFSYSDGDEVAICPHCGWANTPEGE